MWLVVAVGSLDLFTCGSQSLMPLLPLLKELFAIRNDSVPNAPEPVLTWSHKKRGYRDYFGADGQLRNSTNHEDDDDDDDEHSGPTTELELERYLLGSTGVDSQAKTPQLETSTKFQQVEIYGTASSNKRLFLDGVVQSTLNGLEAYHEALVHPALTMVEGAASDSSSLRVAIIGGGEGTTLREVLKHQSVESCTMIDIDAEFMDLARVHLPEWNDCRDLVDAAPVNNNNTTDGYSSCFDHPRARVFPEDAISWFIDRYHNEEDIDESEKFDVIIMDAL